MVYNIRLGTEQIEKPKFGIPYLPLVIGHLSFVSLTGWKTFRLRSAAGSREK